MENFLPGFRKHHHLDDPEEYGRHVHPRPGSFGPIPYTGQPVGFEHLGSPPQQRIVDMDAKTIAQLGYEGPEGDRRKMQAINDVIYDRQADRSGYDHGIPPRSDGYEYREGYSDGYSRHDRPKYHSEHSGYSSSHHRPSYQGPSHYEDEYAGEDSRYWRQRHSGTDRYGRPGPGVPVIPVQVDRSVEEDGTVVERVYPDSTVANAFTPPDHGKIHYGRQDSFAESALQEAAAYAYARRRDYPGGDPSGYPHSSGYAPHYSDATSSYARRPGYEGESSDYVHERDRRY